MDSYRTAKCRNPSNKRFNLFLIFHHQVRNLVHDNNNVRHLISTSTIFLYVAAFYVAKSLQAFFHLILEPVERTDTLGTVIYHLKCKMW